MNGREVRGTRGARPIRVMGPVMVATVVGMVCLALVGCGSSSGSSSKTQSASSAAASTAAASTAAASTAAASTAAASTEAASPAETTSYEEIYDEYAAKLQDATPGLIDEYNAEAAENSDGIQGLASICQSKITKLAEISTEGTQKMARFMYSSGSGSTSEYQDWAGKLTDVYTEEAQKITDAYMDSAM